MAFPSLFAQLAIFCLFAVMAYYQYLNRNKGVTAYLLDIDVMRAPCLNRIVSDLVYTAFADVVLPADGSSVILVDDLLYGF